ncbi:EAL domain-containing protein [Colwellia sp. Arc7-635]|uniref:putative bifunctional diguanylate cyclase/phosphodiesterase n=1 Tax=Colwellia sp. Arc7-635 TaxID=2497879 RepID=UPI000F851EBE|nr:EAL domain-containing protein [Colwellia sp. Arc7-635]AZQ84374.1 EAL domain-containing protein [Colwellia sp. Arc7-635]
MRIRSYLALLVFSCLLGTYTLEQVLTQYFNHVQTLAETHNKHLLWQKDLERIEMSTSQFLVSSDLVVGSGNTYLIFGAINMGSYLDTELSSLRARNHFPGLNNKINRAILNTNKITTILNIVGSISPSNLKQKLSRLLNQYDPVSLELSQDLQFLTIETQRAIRQEKKRIDDDKIIITKVTWLARTLFLLLIIAVWWWANRKICRPLNELIYSSHQALAGNSFKSQTNAPTEIVELSNDFKHITQTLFHQASHDPLTELKNRRAFERSLAGAIADKEFNYVLCFIDLDYFKTINDTCGHAAGDEILIKVARVLKESTRYQDVVARLGGDEFAILIKDCSIDKAVQVANKIKDNIRNLSYCWENETFQLSASIGLAPKMVDSTATDLLHSADVACSLAKNDGRNTVHLFDISGVNLTEERQDLLSVHQVSHALNNDKFILYKQNIVPLQQETKSINHKHGQYFEILLRMKNARDEIVNPSSFLPVAERYQLSGKIDCWVVNAVFKYFTTHQDLLVDIETIAINLSGHSLINNELEKVIVAALKNGPIPPEKICFEITEADAINHIKRVRLFMNNLKALGCEFALDDFGKSNTSHAYIKEFPTSKIKISASDIRNTSENSLDYTAIQSICEVAKITNQKVVAKFVENEDILQVLSELEIDYAQGYYFSDPEALDN